MTTREIGRKQYITQEIDEERRTRRASPSTRKFDQVNNHTVAYSGFIARGSQIIWHEVVVHKWSPGSKSDGYPGLEVLIDPNSIDCPLRPILKTVGIPTEIVNDLVQEVHFISYYVKRFNTYCTVKGQKSSPLMAYCTLFFQVLQKTM